MSREQMRIVAATYLARLEAATEAYYARHKTETCDCALCKESEQLRFDRAGYRGRLERELAAYYNQHKAKCGGCELCKEAERTFTSIARTEPPPI
jgi:hypothetical protein